MRSSSAARPCALSPAPLPLSKHKPHCTDRQTDCQWSADLNLAGNLCDKQLKGIEANSTAFSSVASKETQSSEGEFSAASRRVTRRVTRFRGRSARDAAPQERVLNSELRRSRPSRRSRSSPDYIAHVVPVASVSSAAKTSTPSDKGCAVSVSSKLESVCAAGKVRTDSSSITSNGSSVARKPRAFRIVAKPDLVRCVNKVNTVSVKISSAAVGSSSRAAATSSFCKCNNEPFTKKPKIVSGTVREDIVNVTNKLKTVSISNRSPATITINRPNTTCLGIVSTEGEKPETVIFANESDHTCIVNKASTSNAPNKSDASRLTNKPGFACVAEMPETVTDTNNSGSVRIRERASIVSVSGKPDFTCLTSKPGSVCVPDKSNSVSTPCSQASVSTTSRSLSPRVESENKPDHVNGSEKSDAVCVSGKPGTVCFASKPNAVLISIKNNVNRSDNVCVSSAKSTNSVSSITNGHTNPGSAVDFTNKSNVAGCAAKPSFVSAVDTSKAGSQAVMAGAVSSADKLNVIAEQVCTVSSSGMPDIVSMSNAVSLAYNSKTISVAAKPDILSVANALNAVSVASKPNTASVSNNLNIARALNQGNAVGVARTMTVPSLTSIPNSVSVTKMTYCDSVTYMPNSLYAEEGLHATSVANRSKNVDLMNKPIVLSDTKLPVSIGVAHKPNVASFTTCVSVTNKPSAVSSTSRSNTVSVPSLPSIASVSVTNKPNTGIVTDQPSTVGDNVTSTPEPVCVTQKPVSGSGANIHSSVSASDKQKPATVIDSGRNKPDGSDPDRPKYATADSFTTQPCVLGTTRKEKTIQTAHKQSTGSATEASNILRVQTKPSTFSVASKAYSACATNKLSVTNRVSTVTSVISSNKSGAACKMDTYQPNAAKPAYKEHDDNIAKNPKIKDVGGRKYVASISNRSNSMDVDFRRSDASVTEKSVEAISTFTHKHKPGDAASKPNVCGVTNRSNVSSKASMSDTDGVLKPVLKQPDEINVANEPHIVGVSKQLTSVRAAKKSNTVGVSKQISPVRFTGRPNTGMQHKDAVSVADKLNTVDVPKQKGVVNSAERSNTAIVLQRKGTAPVADKPDVVNVSKCSSAAGDLNKPNTSAPKIHSSAAGPNAVSDTEQQNAEETPKNVSIAKHASTLSETKNPCAVSGTEKQNTDEKPIAVTTAKYAGTVSDAKTSIAVCSEEQQNASENPNSVRITKHASAVSVPKRPNAAGAAKHGSVYSDASKPDIVSIAASSSSAVLSDKPNSTSTTRLAYSGSFVNKPNCVFVKKPIGASSASTKPDTTVMTKQTGAESTANFPNTVSASKNTSAVTVTGKSNTASITTQARADSFAHVPNTVSATKHISSLSVHKKPNSARAVKQASVSVASLSNFVSSSNHTSAVSVASKPSTDGNAKQRNAVSVADMPNTANFTKHTISHTVTDKTVSMTKLASADDFAYKSNAVCATKDTGADAATDSPDIVEITKSTKAGSVTNKAETVSGAINTSAVSVTHKPTTTSYTKDTKADSKSTSVHDAKQTSITDGPHTTRFTSAFSVANEQNTAECASAGITAGKPNSSCDTTECASAGIVAGKPNSSCDSAKCASAGIVAGKPISSCDSAKCASADIVAGKPNSSCDSTECASAGIVAGKPNSSCDSDKCASADIVAGKPNSSCDSTECASAGSVSDKPNSSCAVDHTSAGSTAGRSACAVTAKFTRTVVVAEEQSDDVMKQSRISSVLTRSNSESYVTNIPQNTFVTCEPNLLNATEHLVSDSADRMSKSTIYATKQPVSFSSERMTENVNAAQVPNVISATSEPDRVDDAGRPNIVSIMKQSDPDFRPILNKTDITCSAGDHCVSCVNVDSSCVAKRAKDVRVITQDNLLCFQKTLTVNFGNRTGDMAQTAPVTNISNKSSAQDEAKCHSAGSLHTSQDLSQFQKRVSAPPQTAKLIRPPEKMDTSERHSTETTLSLEAPCTPQAHKESETLASISEIMHHSENSSQTVETQVTNPLETRQPLDMTRASKTALSETVCTYPDGTFSQAETPCSITLMTSPLEVSCSTKVKTGDLVDVHLKQAEEACFSEKGPRRSQIVTPPFKGEMTANFETDPTLPVEMKTMLPSKTVLLSDSKTMLVSETQGVLQSGALAALPSESGTRVSSNMQVPAGTDSSHLSTSTSVVPVSGTNTPFLSTVQLSSPSQTETILSSKISATRPSQTETSLSSKPHITASSETKATLPSRAGVTVLSKTETVPSKTQATSPLEKGTPLSSDDQMSSPFETNIFLSEEQQPSPPVTKGALPSEIQMISLSEAEITSPSETQMLPPSKKEKTLLSDAQESSLSHTKAILSHEIKASSHSKPEVGPSVTQVQSHSDSDNASASEAQVLLLAETEKTIYSETKVSSVSEIETTLSSEIYAVPLSETEVVRSSETRASTLSGADLSPSETQVSSLLETEMAAAAQLSSHTTTKTPLLLKAPLLPESETETIAHSKTKLLLPAKTGRTTPKKELSSLAEKEAMVPSEKQLMSFPKPETVAPTESQISLPLETQLTSLAETNTMLPSETHAMSISGPEKSASSQTPVSSDIQLDSFPLKTLLTSLSEADITSSELHRSSFLETKTESLSDIQLPSCAKTAKQLPSHVQVSTSAPTAAPVGTASFPSMSDAIRSQSQKASLVDLETMSISKTKLKRTSNAKAALLNTKIIKSPQEKAVSSLCTVVRLSDKGTSSNTHLTGMSSDATHPTRAEVTLCSETKTTLPSVTPAPLPSETQTSFPSVRQTPLRLEKLTVETEIKTVSLEEPSSLPSGSETDFPSQTKTVVHQETEKLASNKDSQSEMSPTTPETTTTALSKTEENGCIITETKSPLEVKTSLLVHKDTCQHAESDVTTSKTGMSYLSKRAADCLSETVSLMSKTESICHFKPEAPLSATGKTMCSSDKTSVFLSEGETPPSSRTKPMIDPETKAVPPSETMLYLGTESKDSVTMSATSKKESACSSEIGRDKLSGTTRHKEPTVIHEAAGEKKSCSQPTSAPSSTEVVHLAETAHPSDTAKKRFSCTKVQYPTTQSGPTSGGEISSSQHMGEKKASKVRNSLEGETVLGSERKVLCSEAKTSLHQMQHSDTELMASASETTTPSVFQKKASETNPEEYSPKTKIPDLSGAMTEQSSDVETTHSLSASGSLSSETSFCSIEMEAMPPPVPKSDHPSLRADAPDQLIMDAASPSESAYPAEVSSDLTSRLQTACSYVTNNPPETACPSDSRDHYRAACQSEVNQPDFSALGGREQSQLNHQNTQNTKQQLSSDGGQFPVHSAVSKDSAEHIDTVESAQSTEFNTIVNTYSSAEVLSNSSVQSAGTSSLIGKFERIYTVTSNCTASGIKSIFKTKAIVPATSVKRRNITSSSTACHEKNCCIGSYGKGCSSENASKNKSLIKRGTNSRETSAESDVMAVSAKHPRIHSSQTCESVSTQSSKVAATAVDRTHVVEEKRKDNCTADRETNQNRVVCSSTSVVSRQGCTITGSATFTRELRVLLKKCDIYDRSLASGDYRKHSLHQVSYSGHEETYDKYVCISPPSMSEKDQRFGSTTLASGINSKTAAVGSMRYGKIKKKRKRTTTFHSDMDRREGTDSYNRKPFLSKTYIRQSSSTVSPNKGAPVTKDCVVVLARIVSTPSSGRKVSQNASNCRSSKTGVKAHARCVGCVRSTGIKRKRNMNCNGVKFKLAARNAFIKKKSVGDRLCFKRRIRNKHVERDLNPTIDRYTSEVQNTDISLRKRPKADCRTKQTVCITCRDDMTCGGKHEKNDGGAVRVLQDGLPNNDLSVGSEFASKSRITDHLSPSGKGRHGSADTCFTSSDNSSNVSRSHGNALATCGVKRPYCDVFETSTNSDRVVVKRRQNFVSSAKSGVGINMPHGAFPTMSHDQCLGVNRLHSPDQQSSSVTHSCGTLTAFSCDTDAHEPTSPAIPGVFSNSAPVACTSKASGVSQSISELEVKRARMSASGHKSVIPQAICNTVTSSSAGDMFAKECCVSTGSDSHGAIRTPASTHSAASNKAILQDFMTNPRQKTKTNPCENVFVGSARLVFPNQQCEDSRLWAGNILPSASTQTSPALSATELKTSPRQKIVPLESMKPRVNSLNKSSVCSKSVENRRVIEPRLYQHDGRVEGASSTALSFCRSGALNTRNSAASSNADVRKRLTNYGHVACSSTDSRCANSSRHNGSAGAVVLEVPQLSLNSRRNEGQSNDLPCPRSSVTKLSPTGSASCAARKTSRHSTAGDLVKASSRLCYRDPAMESSISGQMSAVSVTASGPGPAPRFQIEHPSITDARSHFHPDLTLTQHWHGLQLQPYFLAIPYASAAPSTAPVAVTSLCNGYFILPHAAMYLPLTHSSAPHSASPEPVPLDYSTSSSSSK